MGKNLLASEQSPYLLQHKNNPVDWRPWGEAAFAEARAAGKPVFLSIGYSTCYWCHVMEKDSFERADVAEKLNAHFISIKVDREERPDVDEIYMDAVIALTGQGGWPMSVFLTPEGKPFYGGTYFPRDRFLHLLDRIQEAWNGNRADVVGSGEKLLDHLRGPEGIAFSGTSLSAEEAKQNFSLASKFYSDRFDERDGGFGGAPKFPPGAALGFLLREEKRSGGKALSMAETTLLKMACGGIFDQLGGGFHRYATDSEWLVPHFEKMLYDNAMLAHVYAEAFQLTRKEAYADVVHETLAYVAREMTHPEGGFYSAQDAGEVDREGEFYGWEDSELSKILSAEELKAFAALYGASPQGNFEGKNIPNIADTANWESRGNEFVRVACEKLFRVRSQRVFPHLDDKVLTGWNGLMIRAFAKAHQVFGRAEYLDRARAAANFVEGVLWKDGKLLRRYRAGDARFAATSEDYAYLVQGLLSLYESDFNAHWLNWAIEIQRAQDELLWDAVGGGYFSAVASDPTLIFRKKDFHDGAIPSPNAVALENLYRLFHLTHDASFSARAETLAACYAREFSRHPASSAAALQAMEFGLGKVEEIALAGDLSSASMLGFLGALRAEFKPARVIAAGLNSAVGLLAGKEAAANGETLAYLCFDRVCQKPVVSPQDLKALSQKPN